MKVATNFVQVEGSKPLSESKLGIGDEAFIMELLRNKMYSDNKGSIVREITSNARDAHREIGNKDPIKITLPTKLDPYLIIKDHGPGITPDRFNHIFIQYGNSSKRIDNVQTGGFGLGAKSPFSYVDSFSIISIVKEGKVNIKRSYIIFVDETNKGALRLQLETPTTEPTGVEVSIKVQPKDINEFVDAVKQYTYFWDTQPIITNRVSFYETANMPTRNIDFTEILVEPLFELGNAKVFRMNNYWGERQKLFALVDGIPYPIDVGQTKLPFDNGLHLLLKFNTGDVDIIPSREALHYTDKTKDALTKSVNNLKEEYTKSVLKEIENTDTYLNAHRLLINSNKKLFVDQKSYSWNGNDLPKSSFHRPKVIFPEPTKESSGGAFYKYNKRRESSIYSTRRACCHQGIEVVSGHTNLPKLLISSTNKVLPPRASILQYMSEWGLDFVSVLHLKGISKQSAIDEIKKQTNIDINNIYKIVDVSNYQKIKKQGKQDKVEAKVSLTTRAPKGFFTSIGYDSGKELDPLHLPLKGFDKPAYYYITGGYREKYTKEEVLKISNLLKSKIYAVPSRVEDKLNSAAWISIGPVVIMDYIKSDPISTSQLKKYINEHSIGKYEYGNFLNFAKNNKDIIRKAIKNKNVLMEFDSIMENTNDNKEHYDVFSMVQYHYTKSNKQKKINNLEESINQFMQSLPLLSMIDFQDIDDAENNLISIIDYITVFSKSLNKRK